MRIKHPFFRMGLVGLIATLAMHLGFAVSGIAAVGSSLAIWISCYAVWLSFTVLGLALSRRAARAPLAGRATDR